MLADLLRSCKLKGCIAACGMAASTELNMTVYPFILRGVALAGVDSAWADQKKRIEIWNRLAADWKVPQLEEMTTEIELNGVEDRVAEILAGRVIGRTVVKI